jgi:hypothetical protein
MSSRPKDRVGSSSWDGRARKGKSQVSSSNSSQLVRESKGRVASSNGSRWARRNRDRVARLWLWFSARANPPPRLAQGRDWQWDRYCQGWKLPLLQLLVFRPESWPEWACCSLRSSYSPLSNGSIGSTSDYQFFGECYHSIVLESYC